ncbi:MAG TPA: biopolymer transporter ExbD [Bacteroidia bacterium]|jgi:biopolymer transport protein ExbD|nr:biopolymer transporter ExbD [Bacteroidia bacterium]HRG51591.1 biopolymer transporter ExbD [Bacteroidia bacterium]
MKLKRRHKEGAEVSTESLNDIMFFLLLFFLIASTLANPSVLKLNLPNSKNAVQMTKQQVTIEVDANHEYMVNKERVTFPDLENVLRIALARTKEPTVVLKMDNSLSIQDLADVMQIGYKLGIKMVLATKSTDK